MVSADRQWKNRFLRRARLVWIGLAASSALIVALFAYTFWTDGAWLGNDVRRLIWFAVVGVLPVFWMSWSSLSALRLLPTSEVPKAVLSPSRRVQLVYAANALIVVAGAAAYRVMRGDSYPLYVAVMTVVLLSFAIAAVLGVIRIAFVGTLYGKYRKSLATH